MPRKSPEKYLLDMVLAGQRIRPRSGTTAGAQVRAEAREPTAAKRISLGAKRVM
jgi:hypothetical protein